MNRNYTSICHSVSTSYRNTSKRVCHSVFVSNEQMIIIQKCNFTVNLQCT